ncbi:hypothetical protein PROFUN_13988 [Planoprotostelium fungivorum]|uniref:Uncharacterized protein n=1 Tax=Planoprotostelium fungivorum TaxID=1890364 RepID=A0A2P6N2M4_9EUKA|nr:hypothetical protein PROFUN_13988 [Planoprotostelium fungivorum]
MPLMRANLAAALSIMVHFLVQSQASSLGILSPTKTSWIEAGLAFGTEAPANDCRCA